MDAAQDQRRSEPAVARRRHRERHLVYGKWLQLAPEALQLRLLVETLRGNDRGDYTVPTGTGLYPAQWNWDSCLVALGLAQFDEPRAVAEIETLFGGQWPDGMVPHILFHGDDSTYFPNTSVWRAGPTRRSSGITQPLVAATVVRRLFECTSDL